MIVGILELTRRTTYGVNKRGVPKYLFTDLNGNKYLVTSKSKSKKNQLCLINDNSEIIDYIGDWDDVICREKALIFYYNIKINKLQINFNIIDENDYIDFTKLFTWSIDPPNCIDIDDCISFEETLTGYNIYVHIVDILSFDDNIKLFEQQSSIYGNNIIHLLPQNLLEKLTFNENELKKAITLIFSIDKNYQINDFKILKSHIINKKQFTYDNVNLKQNIIKKCFDICSQIKTNISIIKIIDSHTFVEFLMVLSNYMIAKYCVDNHINIIFRTHDVPKKEIKIDDKNIEEEIKFKYYNQGEYSFQPKYHYGLNLDYYTHFTSPLRRYCDQYVHRKIFSNKTIENIDIDKMNYINKQIKKIHNQFIISKIEEGCYNAIVTELFQNKIEIYVKEIKQFIKFRIFDKKMDNLLEYILENDKLKIINKRTNKIIEINMYDELQVKIIVNNNYVIPKQRIKIDFNIDLNISYFMQ